MKMKCEGRGIKNPDTLEPMLIPQPVTLHMVPAVAQSLGRVTVSTYWLTVSGLVKLDQHDITVNGPGVITGVADDLLRGDLLLRSLINYDVVLAQTDLHTSERQSPILFRIEETNGLIHKLLYEDMTYDL